MSDLHACAAKQVVSSPWGAPLLGSPSPFAESHAKDAPRQIPSKFRTSPFNRVRISLADQIVHAYMRRTGIQPSPLASNIARGALGIPDPIAQKLISPEALSQLITTGWPPATVAPDGPPPGT